MRSAAELLDAWGIEGQPFAWSVEALRPTPGGLVADVCSTEESTVALLDAAVHVARLVDGSNPRLMVPAAVESVWLSTAPGDRQGAVEIRRRAGNSDEIVVDIAVKTPDGTTCVDIRSLRYADMESEPAQAPGRDADPRSFAHAIEWRPWPEDHDGPAPAPGTLAVVGGYSAVSAELQNQLTQTGYIPAGIAEARYVVYLADPAPAGDDIDCAASLSSEVADLVRQLAGRHERPPGNTVDHHPRRARGRLERGAAAEQPMGTRRRHRSRAPGTVGRARRHRGRRATSAIASRRCRTCCLRRPNASWCCATANFSPRRWCRSPVNQCVNRYGVGRTRHT